MSLSLNLLDLPLETQVHFCTFLNLGDRARFEETSHGAQRVIEMLWRNEADVRRIPNRDNLTLTTIKILTHVSKSDVGKCLMSHPQMNVNKLKRLFSVFGLMYQKTDKGIETASMCFDEKSSTFFIETASAEWIRTSSIIETSDGTFSLTIQHDEINTLCSDEECEILSGQEDLIRYFVRSCFHEICIGQPIGSAAEEERFGVSLFYGAAAIASIGAYFFFKFTRK